MKNSTHNKVTLEDGCTFAVERTPMLEASAAALVINKAIRAKAAELLPSAQALADSRASRASFFLAASKSLSITSSPVFRSAKKSAAEAQDHLSVLLLLASGKASNDAHAVTVRQWRALLAFFHQDLSTGSVSVHGG
jgi:hypothetical protein